MSLSSGVNQSLVNSIARKVYDDYVVGSDFEHVLDRSDLRQAGMVGMLEARRYFDPEKGAWSSFASMRIRGEMIDRLRRQGMVSVPREQYDQVKQLRSAKADLQQRSADVSTAALSSALGWSEQRVQTISCSRVRMEWLDKPVLNEEGGCTHIDTLHSHDPGPEEKTFRVQLAARIRECLEGLPTDDERLILQLRFLEQEVALKKIAELFGVTAQRVHQIQKKAMARMKSCCSNKGISLKDIV